MGVRCGSSVQHFRQHTFGFLRAFPTKTSFKMKSAIVLLAAASAASAHSTWQDLWVGSADKVTADTRVVKDNNPITSLSSPDMFCGRGPATQSGVAEVAGTLQHLYT